MHVVYAKPEWLGGLLFLAVVSGLTGGFCFLNLPTQDGGIRRGLLRLFACTCLAAAIVCWSVEKRYVILHAPRVTVAGSVTALSLENGGRSGPHVVFRVDTPGWEYHTFRIALSHSEYRDEDLQAGDRVRMLVRLWDINIETLDEVTGSHPGWRYDGEDDPTASLLAIVLTVPIMAYGVVKLFQERNKSRGLDDDADSLDDQGDPEDSGLRRTAPESEIQTLGLESRDDS